MSKMYFLPFRPAFDSAGITVPGSQHWFTLAGTNTPSAPFTDVGLTTPHANPVVSNGIGYLDPIYLDPGISYRVRVYAEDAEVGVDTPLEEYDPYVPALANTDVLSDLADTDGSGLLGFIQSGTGAVSRTVQAKLRELVSVKDFGATGNGTTDDTSAIQAAATAVSATGGLLYFPAGSYKITSAISFNGEAVGVKGAGPRASVLLLASAGIDGLVFGDGTTLKNGITIEDIGVNASVTKSGGAAIKINKLNQVSIDNFWIGAQYIGVSIQNSTIVNVSRGQIANPVVTTGIGLLIGGTTGNDHYIRDVIVTGDVANQPAAGFRIEQTDGVWLENCGAIWSGIGLKIAPASGRAVKNIFSSRCAWDTNSSHGVEVVPAAGGEVRRWGSVGDWFSTNTGAGLKVNGAGTVSGIQLIAPRVYNNGDHGITLETGLGYSMFAPRFSGNSTASANTKSGLHIGANVSDIDVFGGVSGPIDGFTNAQKYGIEIDAGTSDNISIQGIKVAGNGTGAILDGASGTSKTIIGCPGYNTRRQGSATITVGNSSVAVTHGLGVTPTANDIQVTPQSNLGGSSVSYYWVSAVSSTTFTISVNTNVATTAINFGWSARVLGA